MEDNQYPSLESCREVLANLMVGEHSARTNSSPVHVIFSHYLPGFLDPVIQSVLNWMVTHDATGKDAEGRPSNQRRFSAAQIAGGYAVDGNRMSWGCGCNRGTVIKVLNTLEEYHIIRRIGDARRAKKGANGEFGSLFELELNYSAWDWQKMQAQKLESLTRNQSRSQKARMALEEKRSLSGADRPARAPKTPSKRSVAQSQQPGIGLSHNPIASIRSVEQSDPQKQNGLSDKPILNQSVPQSNLNHEISLSDSPIRSSATVPQSESAPPLIKESINRNIINDSNMKGLLDYYCWAFSRDANWETLPNPLTNSQVKELQDWVREHGLERVQEVIGTVSRLPKPPTLERAFGLVHHYLIKFPAAGTSPNHKTAAHGKEKELPVPVVDEDALDYDAAEEEEGLQDWKNCIARLSTRDINAVNHLRGQLRQQMERALYSTWFEPARLMGRSDAGELIFGLANNYACEWLESRLKATMERFLSGALDDETQVVFQVVGIEALKLGC